MARAAWSLSLVGLALIAVLSAAPLPSGTSGIAARYPSDAGIASDPAVLFADDFESYDSAAGLTSRWNEAYHSANIRIATEAGNVFAGAKSLEFTVPHTTQRSVEHGRQGREPRAGRPVSPLLRQVRCGLQRRGLEPQRQHHLGPVPAAPVFAPTASTSFSSATKPGVTAPPRPIQARLNVYIYHPDQRDIWGDHFFPTGIVLPFSSQPFDFGPEFVARPDVTPVLGPLVLLRVHGQGQHAWTARRPDRLLARRTADRRLSQPAAARDDGAQDRSLHARSPRLQQQPGAARKWYDNVVAATCTSGRWSPALPRCRRRGSGSCSDVENC